MNALAADFEGGKHSSFHVGMIDGDIEIQPVAHMDELIDMEDRLPYEPWWHLLKDVLYVVSDPTAKLELAQLPIVIDAHQS